MKNPKKGRLLRFLVSDAALIGFVCPAVILTTMAVVHRYGGGYQAAILASIITIAMSAEVCVLGIFLFRFYNTEQAIEQSLKTHTPIEDALIKDWRWRFGPTAAAASGLACTVTSILKWGEVARMIAIAAATALTLLFLVSLATMMVIAIISVRYHIDHRQYKEYRVLLRSYDNAHSAPKTVTVAEVPNYYSW